MGTIPADGGRVVVLVVVVIVTGGNRSRAEAAARAQRDNTPTANTGNSEQGQHGRIASATVQPRGATATRQKPSRTYGASYPGVTIRNDNNGGAWRNRHNGRNVDAVLF